jgi:hypothetical protein
MGIEYPLKFRNTPMVGQRDVHGYFAKGNTLGKEAKKYKEVFKLQDALKVCVNLEKTVAIMDNLYQIAVSDPDPKVRICAGATWMDRAYGRPKENLMIGSQSSMDIPARDLSPEELEQVQMALRILNKPTEPVIDESQVITLLPEQIEEKTENQSEDQTGEECQKPTN